jgi:hypothetical protein
MMSNGFHQLLDVQRTVDPIIDKRQLVGSLGVLMAASIARVARAILISLGQVKNTRNQVNVWQEQHGH